MKSLNRLALGLPLLTLPLLPAFLPRGDEVSFQPEEGTSLSKELELEMKVFLEDVSMIVDGQEMPSEMIMGQIDEGIIFEALIAVTDEYVASARGKHEELLRTFDTMTLDAGPESEAESVDQFGEFEDTTVRFKWDEESEEYLVTFHESAGDEDALSGLSPDMDFLALLPSDEVAEGDTWEATGTELATVFMPGGIVPMDLGEDAPEELGDVIQDALEQQLEEALGDFKVNCTYGGKRSEEETDVGVITIEYEGEIALDLSDLIMEIIEIAAEGEGADFDADIIASLDLEFAGEGSLLWNLEAHHVHEFQMSTEMTVLGDVEADVDAMGEAHVMEASIELSGEAAWSLSTGGE